MRFLRTAVWFILALSILANIFIWKRYTSGRTILSVNGQSITKKEMDDYLEQQFSPEYKAVRVGRILTDQEAQKQNVVPTDKEVEDAFAELKEREWQFAQTLQLRPWLVQERKDEIKQKIEQDRLMTKDIPVTDEEINEEYRGMQSNGSPNAWIYDTPNLAHTELAIVKVDGRISDVQQLLEKSDPPIKPKVIVQQYPQEVQFLGDNEIFTFVQPVGSNVLATIFSMPVGSVKVLDAPSDIQIPGVRKIVVRMMSIQPGHKADLNDPKLKDKIRIAVAKKRSKPWTEFFAPIFDHATFESENAGDREVIERILFPDRADTRK